MATPIQMPRLGESVAEGTIGSWLKQVGDYVERDESLAEVITDKINAELPSPIAGRLTKILVQADETVAVGTDIALIEEEENSGETTNDTSHKTSTSFSVLATTTTPAASLTGTAVNETRPRTSPLARRLAREHGIDLKQITGTGSSGRVRKEDILAYLAQQQANGGPTTQPHPTTSIPKQQPIPTTIPAASVLQNTVYSSNEDEEIIQPSRMRLSIAEHMVRSKQTSPHATTVVEVDMTNIARWLAREKDTFKHREGYNISFVPFVMKAVCEGIRKFPLINSTWTPDNKIIIKKHINLGIAVSTDDGLVVPTVYDADQYTLAGLARQVSMVAQKARNNRLTLHDIQNSTFVVNNPGVFGTIISTPIINQPHAGILSMDAVVKRPVVIEDDAIAVRSMMYLCLSFDHRVMDGAGAAGFLQAVRAKLQSYGREIDVY